MLYAYVRMVRTHNFLYDNSNAQKHDTHPILRGQSAEIRLRFAQPTQCRIISANNLPVKDLAANRMQSQEYVILKNSG